MWFTPKRRWLRFSLRTFFVLVTLLAVLGAWVGYQLNWIRQRHEVLSSAIVFPDGNYVIPMYVPAPFPLRLFGETGYGLLVMPSAGRTATAKEDEDVERVERLFPEAEVTQTDASPKR